MNSPIELLCSPDAVVTDLRASSGEEAIRALHQRLRAATPEVRDARQFMKDLLERFTLSSVCISEDVAMPHARTTAVSRIVLGVARTAAPVAFDAEHPAVRLIFLIGTPKAAVTDYLQAVAALSRMLKNRVTRAALLAAPNETELRAVLARAHKR